MKPTFPVCDCQAEIKAFVEKGLWQGTRHFGPCHCLGFANDSEGLVAGMVYHNYDPHAGVIELSGYAARRDWTNKRWVHLVFDYPFRSWDIRLLAGRHSERNRLVRRIWRRVGACEYLIPEMWGEDEAEAIAVLTRQQWAQSKFRGVSEHG